MHLRRKINGFDCNSFSGKVIILPQPDKGPCTWQFNFRFNLEQDMYAQDSIELLNNSGMDFKRHEEEGIEIPEIAELLISSGLVLCDNVAWITFHSGYDFGYLLRLLTCQNLPAEESDFFELLRLYFPKVYDVKYIMKSCKNLKGGLQEVCCVLTPYYLFVFRPLFVGNLFQLHRPRQNLISALFTIIVIILSIYHCLLNWL